MKRLAAALSALLIFGANCFARDLDTWARTDYESMSKRAMLDNEVIKENLSQNITRAEFCTLIMKLYEARKMVVLEENDKNVFSDTNGEAVLKAYKTGIVSGKGNGEFKPWDNITRQEMAVMLSRMLEQISDSYLLYDNQVIHFYQNYSDSADTDLWAVKEMAAICEKGIISGDDNKYVFPKSNATREQAICMLNRAAEKYISDATIYHTPEIKYADELIMPYGILNISWEAVSNALEYNIIIKTDGGSEAVTVARENNSLSYYAVRTQSKINSVIVGAKLGEKTYVFSAPYEYEEKTEEYNAYFGFSGNIFGSGNDLSEKERRIFPNGAYYQTKEEAEPNMKEVAVPVWVLTSGGEKKSSQKKITVHSSLAEEVVSIFTEIYNDPSQFPVKDVGGYCWRSTASGNISQHSYGTCIDINYNENYYVKPDGTPITGSYWKPGEDPYSIAEDSIVVKTFAKYGWKWGGNAWGDGYSKDYMHFTYLGK